MLDFIALPSPLLLSRKRINTVSPEAEDPTAMGMNAVDDSSSINSSVAGSKKKRPLHQTVACADGSNVAPNRCPNTNRTMRGKVFSSLAGGAQSSNPGCRFDDERVTAIRPINHVGTALGDECCDAVMAMPTADDYANLFFCDPSEDEEEVRASLKAPRDGSRRLQSDHDCIRKSSKRRRRGKRVSFGACIPTFHPLDDVPPAHAMTADEKSAVWFSRSDLDAFKSSAQSAIHDMRARVASSPRGINECKDRSKFRGLMLALERETNSSIRGLEHRVLRRKQTRQSLIRDVLECQAHAAGLARFGYAAMGADERSALLADVSTKRSVGARRAALLDAEDDCYEVRTQQQARQVSVG